MIGWFRRERLQLPVPAEPPALKRPDTAPLTKAVDAPRPPAPKPGPAWFDAATGWLGTKETPGKASNPTILAWARKAGGWIASFYRDDSIPWCALFVNQCLGEVGIKGTGTLAALDFATWGKGMEGPAVGAIAVFKRAGGGHVGFYVGQRLDGAIRVRGGNQSDAVTDTWIAADRLVGYRWPAGFAIPAPAPVILAGDGSPVSTNEA